MRANVIIIVAILCSRWVLVIPTLRWGCVCWQVVDHLSHRGGGLTLAVHSRAVLGVVGDLRALPHLSIDLCRKRLSVWVPVGQEFFPTRKANEGKKSSALKMMQKKPEFSIFFLALARVMFFKYVPQPPSQGLVFRR